MIENFLLLLRVLVALPTSVGPTAPNASEICSAVDSQTLELQPRYANNIYRYQAAFADAAGVTPNDSELVVNSKIAAWLNANMHLLLCEQFNFTPVHGNLLKLAIARQSDPFIDDALRAWHIDLNQVDAVDGKTVIDYIVEKRDNAGSNEILAMIYARYYARFRAAGAKHARELP